MDWQPVAVAVSVALALAYVVRGALRAWRGRSAGCGGCKCPGPEAAARNGKAAALIPPDQLTLRSGRPR
jgi:hypothetical protein